MAYGDIDAGMTEAEKQHLAELEATCEKQSGHISKLGKQIADMEEAASLDAAQKFLFREFAMEAESDLDVIQAAWCDFDAIVEALQAERDKLRKSKDICPVCMTWSWAPCDEGDEGAEQRGEEWALCQCCNDSRIAVLWKGRAEKLREAFKAQHEYIKEAQETLTSYLRPGGIEANRCLGLLLSQFDGPAQRALFKQTEAALGEGGGG